MEVRGGERRAGCDLAVRGQKVGEHRQVVRFTEAARRVLRHLLGDFYIEIAKVMTSVSPGSREVHAGKPNGGRSFEIRSMTGAAGTCVHDASGCDLRVGERDDGGLSGQRWIRRQGAHDQEGVDEVRSN